MKKSIIDLSPVLQIHQKYRVQDVSHFPKRLGFLIGKEVLLVSIQNTSASIRNGGNLFEIPVRALISVAGFKASSVSAKNADGFVITRQNDLGLSIGTALLYPTEIRDESFICVVDGKRISVPLDLVFALVEVKEKVKKALKVKGSSLKSEQSEAFMELLAPASNREEITEIPPVLEKLLPNVNLSILRQIITEAQEGYADYEGNVHSSIADVDKANTKIRYKLLRKKLLNLLNEDMLKEFKAIEDKL